ncbi:hypothetical protein QTP88_023960 [Uroleucon formosanum]
MVWTSTALLNLYESELMEMTEKYPENEFFLMTNRLTQDPLENLFSIIRQRNGYNRNPTARTFRCCFGNICSYSLMKCSDKCNCEEDDDEYLNVDVLKECIIDRPNPDLVETDLDEEQNNLVSDNSSETSSLSLDCSPIPASLETSVQAQWLKFARENGINETLLKPSVSLFCLTHFAASCFDRFTHTTNLKSNAIPTIKIKRVKCAKILYPEIKIPIPVDEPLCIQSNNSTPACRNSTDQPNFKEIKGPSEFSYPTVVQV